MLRLNLIRFTRPSSQSQKIFNATFAVRQKTADNGYQGLSVESLKQFGSLELCRVLRVFAERSRHLNNSCRYDIQLALLHETKQRTVLCPDLSTNVTHLLDVLRALTVMRHNDPSWLAQIVARLKEAPKEQWANAFVALSVLEALDYHRGVFDHALISLLIEKTHPSLHTLPDTSVIRYFNILCKVGWSVDKATEACDAVVERLASKSDVQSREHGAHILLCKALVKARLKHEALIRLIRRWYVEDPIMSETTMGSEHAAVGHCVMLLGEIDSVFATAFAHRTIGRSEVITESSALVLASLITINDQLGTLSHDLLTTTVIPRVQKMIPTMTAGDSVCVVGALGRIADIAPHVESVVLPLLTKIRTASKDDFLLEFKHALDAIPGLRRLTELGVGLGSDEQKVRQCCGLKM